MSIEQTKYEEFVDRMEETYPTMFSEPYGGFAIGEGWWPLVEKLCSSIQSHIDWKFQCFNGGTPNVVVKQIKEKLGGLRFYYEGGDDYVRGLVDMAESMSYSICEKCGKPGTVRSGGWIRTLCDEHAKEYNQKIVDDNDEFCF